MFIGKPPRLTGAKIIRREHSDGFVLMLFFFGFRGYVGIRWPMWWRGRNYVDSKK